MLFFEFFPMFVTVVMVIAAVWLFFTNRRTPYDPAEAEERRQRDDQRREGARRRPREKSGPGRPSMSS